jgi:fluoride ion exporter CrcB/FEX
LDTPASDNLSKLYNRLDKRVSLLSGFQLTIIVLIVLPSVVIISHYFLTEVVINYFKSISTVDTVSENLEYATLAVNLFSAFQIVVFVVMVLIYPPYPAPFSIEKYFVKRGFESAVSEFELVRKILYVAIPLLIFFTVIDILKPLIEQFVSEDVVAMFTENIVFYSARGFLFLTVLAGLLKAVFALSRKRFRLYFAKGCLSIAKNSNDEVEKMEYLIKGLDSYNSYLKRHIKLEINEIKKIYSKITTLPSKEKSDTMNRIIKTFESGDTLEPVRYLSSLHENKTELFLTEEPLEQKIKLQVTYAAGIIPVILTIIQSVINFSGS